MGYIKDLHNFNFFLKKYKFVMPEVTKQDGDLYCDGKLIMKDGKYIAESDSWVNVTSGLQNPLSRMLSNLYHYNFTFAHNKFGSLEGFFQGIKFKDKKLQKEVFKYHGLDALAAKGASDYNWKDEGIIYWQGKPIDRFSKEYDELVKKVYIAAIQNKLYRNALMNCTKTIVHIIGDEKKENSVFTRYEFEYMLNALKEYLIEENNKKKTLTNR